MNEEKLREDLKNYVNTTGVKYCFISKILGIENTTFSRWKNKKRNLQISELYRLQKYLENKNNTF